MCKFLLKILDLFSICSTSKDSAISGRAEIDREKHRCDEVPAHKRASPEGTQTDLAPFSNWTLNEFCRECTVPGDVNCFVGMAVDGNILSMYARICFERDTALHAWK